MARLALTKASLQAEQRRLQTFVKFLPSLDLKRRQLIAERAKERATGAAVSRQLAAVEDRVGSDLPMLAATADDLSGLAHVAAVDLGRQNVVGVTLPVLRRVDVAVAPYSERATPIWLDLLAMALTEALRLRVRLSVHRDRLALLDAAVRKLTQRVNLFEKVLIPRTKANIARIRIHLADAERAGVVRAKLAKQQRARTTEALTP